MKQAFKPYARFGMSGIARRVLDDADWLRRCRESNLSPDHPDFNPDFPRSIAGSLRDGAARIIAGSY
jgi:hypothetical protein